MEELCEEHQATAREGSERRVRCGACALLLVRVHDRHSDAGNESADGGVADGK